MQAQQTITTAKRIRILFFRYEDATAKLITAYQRLFAGRGDITHTMIQTDAYLHEIAMKNCETTFYPGDIKLLKNLIGYYEFDLTDVDQEQIQAALFCIRNDINSQRTFKPWECLSYAKQFMCWDFRRQTDTLEFIEQVRDPDLTLKPGIRKYGARFHYVPPFTCATQAADLITRLYGMDIGCECHIPEMVFAFCYAMAYNGLGELTLSEEYNVRVS